jgi:enoyl-CoA hydratase/carnithine racemase
MPQTPDEDKVEFAATNFSDCLQGDEGKEGVASFVEKRKPTWHTEMES